jgi:hypothetical protein
MKLFKSLLGMAMILLLSSSVAYGQEKNKKPTQRAPLTTEQRAQRQTDNFVKKNELNEKQAKEVKEIYIKYGEKIEGLNKNAEASAKNKEVAMARSKQEAELVKVLTEEQLAAYKEKKAKKVEKYTKKKAVRPAKETLLTPDQRAQKRTDRLIKKLELTREQVPQVSKANLEYYTALAGVDMEGEDRAAIKAEKKALKADYDASLKKVLTEAQFTKMNEKPKVERTTERQSKKN